MIRTPEIESYKTSRRSGSNSKEEKTGSEL